ncbi:hypothetical protein PRIPAC_72372, partial [Pristionchus pacificus]|uniref:Uncharacterized protein n=1 Tax=Pristionchus pacificus TaxID=54126 RepID=A0A2A6D0K7_PRIPA
ERNVYFFLNLRENAIKRICYFLDCDATVAMRKVSKSSRGHMDSYVMMTQVRNIEYIRIYETSKGSVIEFTFYHWWDCLMLNNVVRSILETHSMHPFNIKIENSFHSRICVMMETTTMIRLLEHLKPLLRMKSIYMETDNSDIIYTCANVLQGNIFAVENCLYLIDEVKPEHVVFSSFKCLLRIAEIAKSMYIFHLSKSSSHVEYASVILSILSRKCEKLEIRVDDCFRYPVSIAQSEKLIQFLHHSEKQLHLYTRPKICFLHAFDVQLGTYNVVSRSWDYSIKSVEWTDFNY